MAWDWQQIVALACVAGAAFLLVRRMLRWWQGSPGGGCGSACQGCAVKDDPSLPASKPLVTLDVVRPQAPSTRPKR